MENTPVAIPEASSAPLAPLPPEQLDAAFSGNMSRDEVLNLLGMDANANNETLILGEPTESGDVFTGDNDVEPETADSSAEKKAEEQDEIIESPVEELRRAWKRAEETGDTDELDQLRSIQDLRNSLVKSEDSTATSEQVKKSDEMMVKLKNTIADVFESSGLWDKAKEADNEAIKRFSAGVIELYMKEFGKPKEDDKEPVESFIVNLLMAVFSVAEFSLSNLDEAVTSG